MYATLYFDSNRWGTFRPGINNLKRAAEAERQQFVRTKGVMTMAVGGQELTFLHWKRLPIRVRLMNLRRTAQRQPPMTIEPDDDTKKMIAQKRHLRRGSDV